MREMKKTTDLVFRRQNFSLNWGFSEFANGEIHFIIGPNGSGKTTALRLLSGLLKPVEGSIEDFHADSPERLGLPAAYMPARSEIQFGVTGTDLLDLLHTRNSKWANAPELESLDTARLLRIPLESLSSGEAQRVCLFAVLSHPGDFVFLDEPLTHLDWKYSLRLQKIIMAQTKAGRSFILSNHDLNWCLQFPLARGTLLDKGQVIARDFVEELLRQPKVQNVFGFRAELVTNPLSGCKLLAIDSAEKKAES